MNSRALTTSDIGWIVRIMYENLYLVQNRERLCLGLGLSMSEVVDIARDKASGTQGFLTLALNKWISRNSDVTFEKLIEVLRSEKFNSTAENIKENLPLHPLNSEEDTLDLKSSVSSIWFDVPEDVHMFTGRVEDLKQLHESIIAQNLGDGKNDMTVITAVCGMGGVGKTTLTVHYAWTFFKVFYVNVIWINSETKITIADSFKRLAGKLGKNVSFELCDIVAGIYEHFSKARTLLIFDNVECYEDVKYYIPARSPNTVRPYVLLSSRNRNWHFRTHLIDLNVFKTEESVEFFKSYLSLTTEEELEQAQLISDALHNLPLAIRQAGAYIKMQNRENSKAIVEVLRMYLELFMSNSIQLLKFDHSSFAEDIYEKTIFSNLTVNMEKLTQQNRLTRTIVELISYLNSDNIPIKLFCLIPKWLQGGLINRLFKQSYVQIVDVNLAVALLTNYSMIRYVDSESISVHRLLQKVVRTQVEQKYKGSQFDWIIDLIEISLGLNNNDNYEDICLRHAMSVRDHMPPHLIQRTRIQTFLKLIERKQHNSVTNNIKQLQELLKKDKFDDALESYQTSIILYAPHGMSFEYSIEKEFAVLFVNTICLEMLKDYSSYSINARALKLCQLIKEVFRGLNISSNEVSKEASQILRQTVWKMYKTFGMLPPEKSIDIRQDILSLVQYMLDFYKV